LTHRSQFMQEPRTLFGKILKAFVNSCGVQHNLLTEHKPCVITVNDDGSWIHVGSIHYPVATITAVLLTGSAAEPSIVIWVKSGDSYEERYETAPMVLAEALELHRRLVGSFTAPNNPTKTIQ
jgi:hypothetical protein